MPGVKLVAEEENTVVRPASFQSTLGLGRVGLGGEGCRGWEGACGEGCGEMGFLVSKEAEKVLEMRLSRSTCSPGFSNAPALGAGDSEKAGGCDA